MGAGVKPANIGRRAGDKITRRTPRRVELRSSSNQSEKAQVVMLGPSKLLGFGDGQAIVQESLEQKRSRQLWR